MTPKLDGGDQREQGKRRDDHRLQGDKAEQPDQQRQPKLSTAETDHAAYQADRNGGAGRRIDADALGPPSDLTDCAGTDSLLGRCHPGNGSH